MCSSFFVDYEIQDDELHSKNEINMIKGDYNKQIHQNGLM